MLSCHIIIVPEMVGCFFVCLFISTKTVDIFLISPSAVAPLKPTTYVFREILYLPQLNKTGER